MGADGYNAVWPRPALFARAIDPLDAGVAVFADLLDRASLYAARAAALLLADSECVGKGRGDPVAALCWRPSDRGDQASLSAGTGTCFAPGSGPVPTRSGAIRAQGADALTAPFCGVTCPGRCGLVSRRATQGLGPHATAPRGLTGLVAAAGLRQRVFLAQLSRF